MELWLKRLLYYRDRLESLYLTPRRRTRIPLFFRVFKSNAKKTKESVQPTFQFFQY